MKGTLHVTLQNAKTVLLVGQNHHRRTKGFNIGTGTDDKIKAQEFHDRLKPRCGKQNRLGVKARRSWKDAVVHWLEETSEGHAPGGQAQADLA